MSAPDVQGGRRLPSTFRSLVTLRVLNVLAVGFSLAAATGAVFGCILGINRPNADFTARAAVPTLFFGILWAIALRHRKTFGSSKLRWGWLASIPFAVANGATVGALMMLNSTFGGGRPVHYGALWGATVGALFWLPGLLATLFWFGIPIAWAERLAQKGIAGEERGEIIVGSVSAAIGLAAFAVLIEHRAAAIQATRNLDSTFMSFDFVAAFGLIAAAAGLAAALFALRRERARRAFVLEVEAGAVEGFRVDASADRKVLLRVSSMGEGYRVADIEEPVLELSASGEVRRELALPALAPPERERGSPPQPREP